MRIDRKPLQAEIIARIRGYIEQRGLKEGDALPSQMEMVDLFGVSRSSIREALKTLEALDVVRVINGRGVFVRHVDTRMILARAFDIRKKEHFLEILGVRKLLEDEIIRQADHSLYQAKNLGRNRVVSASAEPAPFMPN